MPIYEYSCAKCGKTIEVIQKMSANPLKTHAGCGGKLTKLISASGFQFKGTGWYVTDYARKGKTDGGPTQSESSSSTETKSETKSTSATETTATKPEKPAKPAKSSKS